MLYVLYYICLYIQKQNSIDVKNIQEISVYNNVMEYNFHFVFLHIFLYVILLTIYLYDFFIALLYIYIFLAIIMYLQ